MNALLRTPSGLSLLISGKTYTVQSTHLNYKEIVEAIKEKRWDEVPDLINLSNSVKKYVEDTVKVNSDLRVDAEAGTVLFRDIVLSFTLTERILDMVRDGFSIEPMALFLDRLYKNPSYKAIEQLYGWMEANGLTISEDGHLLAFKRVNESFLSMYDNKTENFVGTYVQMPRNMVDDRSENTCSAGLHFCSQAYLPHYNGGKGQVLLLKIDPADVVSIPTDYNNAKGRACKYFVLDALEGDAREGVETRNVIAQPVITAETKYNATDAFKMGYRAGYKDGRGKQAHGKSRNHTGLDGYDQLDRAGLVAEYDKGYDEGRSDGRTKKPNLYGGEVLLAEKVVANTSVVEQPIDPKLLAEVCDTVGEMLGFDVTDQTIQPDSNLFEDLGADSLDAVELTMAIEDDFGIQITDEEAEACKTPRDIVKLIATIRARD